MALGALQSDSNEGKIGTGQNKNKKEVVADQAGDKEPVEENISQTTESIDAVSLSAKENDVAVDVETLKENDSERQIILYKREDPINTLTSLYKQRCGFSMQFSFQYFSHFMGDI